MLHIKNMVCDRCIMVLKQQLENLSFTTGQVTLGTSEVRPDPESQQLSKISSAFKVLGFELIDIEKDKIVARIKSLIVKKIHHSDLSDTHLSFSSLLADTLNKDYAYFSRLFSESEGTTIERFIIQQKIEKVKELVEYGEYDLNEIAYKMGHSNCAHLSAQFKSVTGLTPSQFKISSGDNRRKPIDKI
jgi:AraC family transcriptional regulator